MCCYQCECNDREDKIIERNAGERGQLVIGENGIENSKELCRRFVKLILQLGRDIFFEFERAQLRVIAYNGGRFDFILLLKYLAEECGNEISIAGTVNSIKFMSIGNIRFEDALLMTGCGSLDSFAKAMNVGGKSEAKNLLTRIEKADEWRAGLSEAE